MTTNSAEPDVTRAKEIFLAALDLAPEDRRAFVALQCGTDDRLRQEVQTLLTHDAAAGGGEFLAAPAIDPAEMMRTLDPTTLLTAPGTMIGRYKILEPIGEGGFGTVFMAEQTTPVQRRVALKIIKAGMDTKQVIARFEAERQALALMDHPNIAKVFDAGVTDTGRPYFVMELVKGTPITKYCDEHRLQPSARLELFIQVCQAVQHAHQKGIIHRDLKPSNVLIMQYDGQPVPKVIDFGVAKATGQRLTEMTMFTGFGDVIGTPQYMSPEQAELNQLDIDTRSDIYSLGVLLYELLTGTTPLEAKRVKEAALLEVLRVIREEEPPRPSTRLTATAELPSIAAQRGLDPKHLAKMVHGELDWIVMKALEKDRGRRYETANGLARDLERYMNDEPVSACPPTTAYRLQKFVRRNRTALLIAISAFAALIALVAILTVSNVRVARERNQKAVALTERERALAAAKASADRAEAQRQRAERNFYNARVAVMEILAQAATGRGDWATLSPALRKTFSQATAQYYQTMVQEGTSDPAVRHETAVGYRSLGFLHFQSQEYEPAEKLLRQSIMVLDELVAAHPQDPNHRQQLAWSSYMLCLTLKAMNRRAEAEVEAEKALRLYQDLLSEQPGNANYLAEREFVRGTLRKLNSERGASTQTVNKLLVGADEALLKRQIETTTRGSSEHQDAWSRRATLLLWQGDVEGLSPRLPRDDRTFRDN
jgi:serine/threonine protein kinase